MPLFTQLPACVALVVLGPMAIGSVRDTHATAEPLCPVIQVEASLDAALRTVAGELRCTLARDAQNIWVTTYPRVLGKADALNDVNRTWHYPKGRDSSRMHIRRIEGQPKQKAASASPPWGAPKGAWQAIGGGKAGETLHMRFLTKVPEHNGTFGRRQRTLYLLGGWLPLPSDSGTIDGVPMPVYSGTQEGTQEPRYSGTREGVRFEYRLRIPRGRIGLVGSQLFQQRDRHVWAGHHHGRDLPLLIADELELSQRGPLRIIAPSFNSRPPTPASASWLPRGSLSSAVRREFWQFGKTSAREHLQDTLDAGAAFLEASGVRTVPYLIIVAPLRERLIENFDTGTALSDRAFHLPNWERLLKLHRAAVWRGQFGHALEHHLQGQRNLPPDIQRDALACILRDTWLQEVYGTPEWAQEILEPVAIIPEIDALIHAPQVPFADAYFDAIDERSGARIRLDDYYHLRPRGKLLYEKWADRIGKKRLQRLLRAYLRSGEERDFTSFARSKTGIHLLRDFERWYGPAPQVDYALGSTTTNASGTRVEILAFGPDASHLREPLVVSAKDALGAAHQARRLGPGWVDLPRLTPPRLPLARLTLDPEQRLVELWHQSPESHPRGNNTNPGRWRFLLNRITGLVAATSGNLALGADFGLRQIHNPRTQFSFGASYASGSVGGAVGWTRSFGSQVTPMRLRHHTTLGLAGSRTAPQGFGLSPAWEGRIGLTYAYDTRLSAYSSFQGTAIRLGGRLMLGTEGGGTYRGGGLGLGLLRLWHLAPGQALATRLSMDGVIGPVPEQNLLTIGDRYVARGYEPQEARAQSRVVMTLEHRHLLAGDLAIDLGFATWTRLEGALFGDVVWTPIGRRSCEHTVYPDIGYGLRFLGDVLNAAPSTVAVDVGVPLRRCNVGRRNLPITLYVAFVQSLLVF